MAKKQKESTLGNDLAVKLLAGVYEADHASKAGARDLPNLRGALRKPGFSLPQETVLLDAIQIAVASSRVFTYGDDVVMTAPAVDGHQRLVALRTGAEVAASAAASLANLLICRDTAGEYPPPKWLVEILLHSELTIAQLPRIRTYARRPVFDQNFSLCGPGWHAAEGLLVQGPHVEPVLPEPVDPTADIQLRLPPHLRSLLQNFCFRQPADVANAVGVLLTGVLINHFVEHPKPVAELDGNQPGTGKTLFTRVESFLLGGVDARRIHYTEDEEELQKRICATVRDHQQCVLLIDNAKVRSGTELSSPTIEANCESSIVSLRILGKSENTSRPNDLIWMLTMNDTKLSRDLIQRGIPIRMYYEGDPAQREFGDADPVAYVREHRLEILGELMGMVIHWTQAGRPAGSAKHRYGHWAKIIGGVLQANGLPEFLSNVAEAAADFDTTLGELTALAEAALGLGADYYTTNPEVTNG